MSQSSFNLIKEISFNLGNVDSLLINETDSNSMNISLSHFVGMRDGNDFDTDNFQLSMPLTFRKKSTDSIDLSTTYYFEANRNTILKFYEWNAGKGVIPSPFDGVLFPKIAALRKLLTVHFKKKFDDIESSIISTLGSPYFRNIESENKLKTNGTMRDDVNWANNEIKVHLYRFSHQDNGFNQIRVLIYKK